MSQPSALRVALLQRGRIIEERTFPGRATVTVGTALGATFLVPSDEVPAELTLFEVDRDGATRLGPSLDGCVTVDGQPTAVSAWSTTAPLPRSAKGRLSVGDVSFVFHFVAVRAPRPRAVLPKELRASALAQFDRLFMAVLVVSLGAHFAGVGYLASQPPPPEAPEWEPERPVDRFARARLPAPLPKPPAEAAAKSPAPAAKPAPAVAEAPAPRRHGLGGDALKERLKKMGMMGVIGSRGEGEGAFGDLLKDAGTTDVARALDGAGSARVASAEDAVALARRGAETGDAESIGPLGPNGPIGRPVELREREGTQLPGDVKQGPIEVETPDIDPNQLARWMQQRKGAIQGCYERELKRLPSLSGRVVLRFNITPRGRVGGLAFDDDTLRSARVEDCISGLMRAWVTPFTPEDDVPVALPFIFAPGATR